MSLISRIVWCLSSNDRKIRRLRKQGLVIGEGCEVLNGCDFGSEPWLVEIGDNVRITSGVKITTHDGGMWVLRHLYPELRDADRFGKVRIGSNCHIGMGAMVMPGVTVGENCVVGAHAVVTRDIPPNSVAVGVPARVIETIDEYKRKCEGSAVPTKGMTSEEKRKWFATHPGYGSVGGV